MIPEYRNQQEEIEDLQHQIKALEKEQCACVHDWSYPYENYDPVSGKGTKGEMIYVCLRCGVRQVKTS